MSMWVYIYDVCIKNVNKAWFLWFGFIFSGNRRCTTVSTMATQRVLPQSKETLLQSYNKRLKDDIKSILENFTEIIKTAKVCRANALSTAIVFFKLCCVRYFIILRSVLPNYRVFIYDWKQEEQCALSADRGRDTGFPTNPSRTGPLWDAR